MFMSTETSYNGAAASIGDSAEFIGAYSTTLYEWQGDIAWTLIDPNNAWSEEIYAFSDDPYAH